ncbi:HDOD domain-containing protein [Alteromonas sp. ASW11-130]|uniref:HDOD domain-containing protein n=1 Tax=Alteromonas sp. ASW11-130 TaxID=3015775 RepID=UPI00224282D2|nr:HDOD domain-containing protein [Alteromonas sp. ASW11-130]MCW8090940.1 HDOD domain-containing protein [Alteromonas sp. ASW11-130]
MIERLTMHSDFGKKSVIQNVLSHAGVDDRFENLLISLERAQTLAGKVTPGEVSYEESEQAEARRELLTIEKIAIKNQSLQELSHATFKGAVNHDFHRFLFSAIRKRTTNLSKVCTQNLGFTTNIKLLLEILHLDSTSLTKVEEQIKTHPWLSYEIMKVVNLPQLRRKDAKGNSIQVASIRTALSYLGLENLKQVVPYMILKRSLPQTTDPYPDIKNHLFNFGVSSAVCASLIAPLQRLDANAAYLLGATHGIGRCILIKLYFRLFESTRNELMEQAIKKKRVDIHKVLGNIKPSPNYLIALQQEFADSVTVDLLTHISPRKLQLSQSLHSLSTKNPLPMGRVLAWAREYAKVRMLLQHRCIDRKMVKIHLLSVGFPQEAVDILNHAQVSAPPFSQTARYN